MAWKMTEVREQRVRFVVRASEVGRNLQPVTDVLIARCNECHGTGHLKASTTRTDSRHEFFSSL